MSFRSFRAPRGATLDPSCDWGTFLQIPGKQLPRFGNIFRIIFAKKSQNTRKNECPESSPGKVFHQTSAKASQCEIYTVITICFGWLNNTVVVVGCVWCTFRVILVSLCTALYAQWLSGASKECLRKLTEKGVPKSHASHTPRQVVEPF